MRRADNGGPALRLRGRQAHLPVLVPFGLRPAKDGVTLTDESFLATFGFIRLTTPRTNITGAHITRNYRWWTAFGVRGSLVDDGLSSGTNHDAGVAFTLPRRCPPTPSDRPAASSPTSSGRHLPPPPATATKTGHLPALDRGHHRGRYEEASRASVRSRACDAAGGANDPEGKPAGQWAKPR